MRLQLRVEIYPCPTQPLTVILILCQPPSFQRTVFSNIDSELVSKQKRDNYRTQNYLKAGLALFWFCHVYTVVMRTVCTTYINKIVLIAVGYSSSTCLSLASGVAECTMTMFWDSSDWAGASGSPTSSILHRTTNGAHKDKHIQTNIPQTHVH